MMKATAESFWVERNKQGVKRTTAVTFGGWLNKAKLALRHFVVPNKSYSRIWYAFTLRQLQKIDTAELSAKDECFTNGGYNNLKHIPHKTWKRHSAFLVYQQQMTSIQSRKALRTDEASTRTVNTPGNEARNH